MKCPYHSEMGCAKFDLLPCVGLDNCAYMNGSSNLLQGIQTPYAELKAQKEKAESELKAIRDRIEAVTEYKINFIINNHLEKYYFNMGAFEPEPFKELVRELIKQIGGVK